MRRFLNVRPTILFALGGIVFALVSIETANAEDIAKISPQHTCSCELAYEKCSCYPLDCEYNACGEADEIRNGDHYYQQKYVLLYSQPVELSESQSARHEKHEEVEKREEDGRELLYAIPENMYGSSALPFIDEIVAAAVMEPAWSDWQYWLDDQYAGSPYVAEDRPEFDRETGLALFTWHPAELLTREDRGALRALSAAGERAPGVRCAIFSDYIENLGADALDLSNRFWEASGLVVPAMADDLSQTAVFIACVRLVERGELKPEEALVLLIKSLSSRSEQWSRWVDRVASEDQYETEEKLSEDVSREAEDDLAAGNVDSAANPMLKAAVLTAAASLERLGDTISGISRRIRELY